MKKTIAVFFAMMAFALSPAHGQKSPEMKACFKRCIDGYPVKNIKKSEYDAEAVENDPAKTDAEKKKSHKKAIAKACDYMCTDD